MSIFSEYSRYYDLFYRDKDYQGEAAYIHSLITRHAPEARTILNLGCGSGRHDRCLSDLGYQITGVDRSEEMLAAAKSAAQSDAQLTYAAGDIRTVRLDSTFDAVISLFHVMSYQTTNRDLHDAFATAAAHLQPGGLFIFDCWYGPGVLTDPPVVRVKEVLADDGIQVTRIAQPQLHAEKNVVDVNYHVLLTDPASGSYRELRETHHMRYLFNPEVELGLSCAGFESPVAMEWLSNQPLGLSSWNAVFIAHKH